MRHLACLLLAAFAQVASAHDTWFQPVGNSLLLGTGNTFPLFETGVGAPYLASPLGEGAGRDPDPRFRLDAFDCCPTIRLAIQGTTGLWTAADWPGLARVGALRLEGHRTNPADLAMFAGLQVERGVQLERFFKCLAAQCLAPGDAIAERHVLQCLHLAGL